MIEAATAHQEEDSRVLFLALESGRKEWQLGFRTRAGRRPRERTIQPAKRRFQLPAGAEVVRCYEAGRDGVWIHRFLEATGVRSHVVDSASIEVRRGRRRRRTDRLDLDALLRQLIRYWGGERKVWSVLRRPRTPDSCTGS